MRTLLGMLLVVMGACTGTRTGNPGGVPAGVVLAQSKLARETTPTLSAQKSQTFGSDNRAFALALYRELAKTEGNLFFSPYSISTALAMTYAGAKGDTATEMASALHFTLPQAELHPAFNATDQLLAKRKDQLIQSNEGSQTTGDGFQFHLVNQAWGRKGYHFLSSYLDVLASNYGAGMFLIDFTQPAAARTTINDWVSEQTEQRIQDLLPDGSVDANTALVLTDAIYFKASWLDEFDPAATKQDTFNAEAGDRSVQMMHAMLEEDYAQFQGYQAVTLPYISPDVRMMVVLPPAGAFGDAASKFDASVFDGLRTMLNRYLVTLSLPKWQFDSEHTLKDPLRALGMKAAFEPGTADLSGMDGAPGNLYIDDVYHKAFISVDEQGTEAAAATAVVASLVSKPAQVSVRFDRPFIFVVYDGPTGQILFIGHLSDPG